MFVEMQGGVRGLVEGPRYDPHQLLTASTVCVTAEANMQ
jgi:hypothetical protein